MTDFEAIRAGLSDVEEAGNQIIRDQRPFGAELLTDTEFTPDQVGGLACINTLQTTVDDATAINTEGPVGLELPGGATREEVGSLF